MSEQGMTVNSLSTSIPFLRKGLRGLNLVVVIIVGLVFMGLLAAGLFLAPTYAAYGLAFIGLGIPVAILLWIRPEFGLITIILLMSSLIPLDIIDIRLPIGGGLDLRDLFFLGSFGLILFRELTRKTIFESWWGVGGLLIVFLILALISGAYSLFIQGTEINWAFNDLRILGYYIIFFMVIWSIKDSKQIKTLLFGLFIIADLSSAIMILQLIVGANNPLLEAMTSNRTWRIYEANGVIRVVPAGQVLMHFMWLIALGLLVYNWQNKRLRYWCAFQLMFIGIAHIQYFLLFLSRI